VCRFTGLRGLQLSEGVPRVFQELHLSEIRAQRVTYVQRSCPLDPPPFYLTAIGLQGRTAGP